MPKHLCHKKYFNLVGVMPGMSVIVTPSQNVMMINTAISQCKNIAVLVY
jgi:hypothetical protein